MAEKRPLPKSLASQAPIRLSKAARNTPSDHTALQTSAFPLYGPPTIIKRRLPIIRKYPNKISSGGDPILPEGPSHPKGAARLKDPVRPKPPLAQSKKPEASNTRIPPASDNALKHKIPCLHKDRNGSAIAGSLPQADVRKGNGWEGSKIEGNKGRGTREKPITGGHQDGPRTVNRGVESSIPVGLNETNLQAENWNAISPTQTNGESFEELQKKIWRLEQNLEKASELLTRYNAEKAALKLRISHLEDLLDDRSGSPLFVAQNHSGEIGGKAHSSIPDGLMSMEGTMDKALENELFGSQTPFDELSSRASSAASEGSLGNQELVDEVEEAMRAGVEDGFANMERQYEEEEPPYETSQKEDLQLLAYSGGREVRSERNKGKQTPDYYGPKH